MLSQRYLKSGKTSHKYQVESYLPIFDIEHITINYSFMQLVQGGLSNSFFPSFSSKLVFTGSPSLCPNRRGLCLLSSWKALICFPISQCLQVIFSITIHFSALLRLVLILTGCNLSQNICSQEEQQIWILASFPESYLLGCLKYYISHLSK